MKEMYEQKGHILLDWGVSAGSIVPFNLIPRFFGPFFSSILMPISPFILPCLEFDLTYLAPPCRSYMFRPPVTMIVCPVT